MIREQIREQGVVGGPGRQALLSEQSFFLGRMTVQRAELGQASWAGTVLQVVCMYVCGGVTSILWTIYITKTCKTSLLNSNCIQ